MKIAAMVVLAAVSGWFARGIRFDRAPDAPAVPLQRIVESPPIADPLPVIREVLLEATSLGQRNLFAYRAQEEPVVVTQPIEHVAPVIAPPPLVVREPPAPQPIPFPYRYIGTFGPVHNRVAAFKRDGDIVTVRTGERVGAFVLRSIGLESAEIEGADGVRRVPLSSDQ
jgi:hypothetical protein